jgi:hypothetical protein
MEGWRRRKELATATTACCSPTLHRRQKRPGGGTALMRFNALRETRAGMPVPAQYPAFKSAKDPYLVSAGAGAAGAGAA